MPAYARIDGLAAAILIDLQAGTVNVYRPNDPASPVVFLRTGSIAVTLADDFGVTIDFGLVFEATGV